MIQITDAVELRFFEKVIEDLDSGCWLWDARIDDDGYRIFSINRRNQRAHRVAWCICHGSIPGGLHVLHRCDVRSCVNPGHLWLGTNLENIADMVQKGRSPHTKNPHPGVLNGRATMTEAEAREIIRLYASGTVTQQAIADSIGVTKWAVANICHNRTWQHIPRLPLSPVRRGRWGTQFRW